MKKPLRHVLDYLFLTLTMSLGIVLVLLQSGSRTLQIIVVTSMSLAYVLWGIIHHHREGTLHAKITLEYALFAILGTVLVIGLF